MNKTLLILIALVILVGGFSGGYWWSASRPPLLSGNAQPEAPAREPVFYRNPMNPAITSPVPAKDNMGMDYLPVYADANDETSPGSVKIDATTVQNIGVRTTPVIRSTLARTIHAVGRIAYNEERVAKLHPKTEGWIEKLMVDKTGQWVKKGQVLLGIYAPQLVTSQQEYLLALNNWEALKDSPFPDIREGAASLLRSTRERLELLDIPAHQQAELEASGKINKYAHIHSPFDGIVVTLGIRQGQYVTAETELYLIADIRTVWAYVEVYENELPWVKPGDPVEVKIAAIPGRVFQGKVGYIYPYVAEKTRTARLRLVFPNPERLLKPDMFSNVTIQSSRQIDALVVPAEAIIRSGPREQIFVVKSPGRFEPREVQVGVTSAGMTQILSGVTEGEVVVTSSQFLIDSESKLREATAKMLAPPNPAATP